MQKEETERFDFEQSFFQLLGKEVKNVKYIESPPLDDLIGWAQHKEKFHPVQQGVQFTYTTMSGSKDAFLNWSGTFNQYGLAFAEQPWTDFVINGAVWDVSGQKPWSRFLPGTVTEATIFWYPTGAKEPQLGWPRALYPRDIELTFANQYRMYFSASRFDVDTDLITFAEHNVLVVWTAEFAEKNRLCSYGDAKQVSTRQLDSAGRVSRSD